jgi:hypothetical protein
VVADIAKLSVGREAYYTRELATDHEAYLSGHGESPGRWYGAGAATLGLQGEASPAGLQAMFEGRDPTTGELLGRPDGRNGVPAFDVVLRPTKSVSVLYGLGDPATGRAVLAAHHAGLAEAVAYLDGHPGAGRGHGGHEHLSGHQQLAPPRLPRRRPRRGGQQPTSRLARRMGRQRSRGPTCEGAPGCRSGSRLYPGVRRGAPWPAYKAVEGAG